jgi:predicted metal-dependent phosphoesterase TrpH
VDIYENGLDGFIDLHAHTNASDGSLAPGELISLAKSVGLSAMAITDHETFAGFEAARSAAKASGLDLVRGIELNTSVEVPMGLGRRTLHLLAYFPAGEPSRSFLEWNALRQEQRRDRNRRLADRLQQQGVDITLAEVEERGRSVAGRPHFARILVEKGYAADIAGAFQRFIGEEAPAFVEMISPSTREAIETVRLGGGVPVVAHPVRLSLSRRAEERQLLRALKDAGLAGLEVIHSDQPPELQEYYRGIAAEFDLLFTGGSDFHGTPKPKVRLGRGIADNVRVPLQYLERLRELQ